MSNTEERKPSPRVDCQDAAGSFSTGIIEAQVTSESRNIEPLKAPAADFSAAEILRSKGLNATGFDELFPAPATGFDEQATRALLDHHLTFRQLKGLGNSHSLAVPGTKDAGG